MKSGLKIEKGFTGGLIRAEAASPVPPVPGEGGELFDFESVEDRLIQAFETLAQLPDRERGWLRVGTMRLWREVLPERVDIDCEPTPARPGVSRAELARMEQALGWCEWLGGEDRRVVGAAIDWQRQGRQLDWPAIRRKLRSERTTDALRKAYSRALSRICGRLNAGTGKHF